LNPGGYACGDSSRCVFDNEAVHGTGAQDGSGTQITLRVGFLARKA